MDLGFLCPMLIQILGSKKIPISDLLADIINMNDCGYQKIVTKICKRTGYATIIKLYSKHQCNEQ